MMKLLGHRQSPQRADLVLTAWKPFEEEHGSPEDIQRVNKINPHKELAWEPSELGGMEEGMILRPSQRAR